MSTIDENELLKKAESIAAHLAGGGTLKSFVDISDKELEALYAVAYNHFTAGKYDKAIDLFKFLCLYDHLNPRWFYSLGIAQQRKGDYSRALEAFAGATILDASDPRPQLQAGYCLMALEQWAEAEYALEGTILTCASDPNRSSTRLQAETMLATVKDRLEGRKGTA